MQGPFQMSVDTMSIPKPSACSAKRRLKGRTGRRGRERAAVEAAVATAAAAAAHHALLRDSPVEGAHPMSDIEEHAVLLGCVDRWVDRQCPV